MAAHRFRWSVAWTPQAPAARGPLMATKHNMPDVLIIGAGGTGAVMAKELAEAGLGVVVLEAGPWHDPQREFTGLEWDMFNPFDSLFRWGPLDRTKAPWPRVRD